MRFRLIGALAAPLCLAAIAVAGGATAARRSAERGGRPGLRLRPVAERQPCSPGAAAAKRVLQLLRGTTGPSCMPPRLSPSSGARSGATRRSPATRSPVSTTSTGHVGGTAYLHTNAEYTDSSGNVNTTNVSKSSELTRLLGDTFGRAFDECRSRRGREGHGQQPGAERVLPGLFGPAARQRRLLRVAQLRDDQRHPGAVRLLLLSRRRPGLRSAGADEPRPQPGPLRARECERATS